MANVRFAQSTSTFHLALFKYLEFDMNLPMVFHHISKEMQFIKRIQTSNGGFLFGRSNIVISAEYSLYFTYFAHRKLTPTENMSKELGRKGSKTSNSVCVALMLCVYKHSSKVQTFLCSRQIFYII